MPKVDLNPLQSGGSVDPVNDPTGTAVKALTLMVSMGLFFALMSAGRATVEPVVGSFLSMIPGVQAGGSNGPWEGF